MDGYHIIYKNKGMQIENLKMDITTYFRNETSFTVDINGKEYRGDFIEEGDGSGLDTSIKWDKKPRISEQEEQDLCGLMLNS